MISKTIEKNPEKVKVIMKINTSLANAIRRNISEISTLAITEADIYKNDSALYDEIISHRLGLIPLKNQKLKDGQTIELKLHVKTKEGERKEVLAKELGPEVVYPNMPLVILENGQEIKLVARANSGKGKTHSKYVPGILYYSNLPKITLSAEGEKQTELAELYPKVFEMMGEKVKVKDEAACTLDEEDLAEYSGVSLSMTDELVVSVESWGHLDAKDIFTESCKTLKSDLAQVSKKLK